ncbi:DUF397 domain-containing protein [Streptomyces phaeochromogenes]
MPFAHSAGGDDEPVRDSKTPQGPALVLGAEPWALFLGNVSRGSGAKVR